MPASASASASASRHRLALPAEPIAAEIVQALAPHGIVPDAVEPLAGGMQNPIWRIRQGQRWLVLRRTRPPAPAGRARSPDQIDWEHAFLAHLHGAGLPVPAPLVAADGRSYHQDPGGGGWSLFPYLPGTPIHWTSPTPPSARQGDAAIDVLLDVHAAARSFPRRDQRPGMGGMMQLCEWIADAYAGIGDIGQCLRQAHRRAPGASPARLDLCRQIDAIDICLDAMRRAADDFARERVETIAIHGDFAPSNLGYLGDRVVAIYDLDDAYRDVRAMDVAQAIVTCATTGRDRFDAATAIRLLRRYHRNMPLSAIELRHLPTCFAAKMMLYALPGVVRQLREPDRDHAWIFGVFVQPALRHLAAVDEWEGIVAAAV